MISGTCTSSIERIAVWHFLTAHIMSKTCNIQAISVLGAEYRAEGAVSRGSADKQLESRWIVNSGYGVSKSEFTTGGIISAGRVRPNGTRSATDGHVILKSSVGRRYRKQ